MLLISPEMLQQNRLLHRRDGYGGSGWKHAQAVADFAVLVQASNVLDYGCGEGTLRVALGKGSKKREIEGLHWVGKVREYDPAIKGKTKVKAADLVVCTDVLEHIEPKLLDNVLTHIRELARKGAYLSIATRRSNKTLPDGRNAHLIRKSACWWVRKVQRAGMLIDNWEEQRRKNDDGPHSVRIWVRA